MIYETYNFNKDIDNIYLQMCTPRRMREVEMFLYDMPLNLSNSMGSKVGIL